MPKNPIAAAVANMTASEHVTWAHELMSAQIAKAEACGLPADALCAAMLSLALERAQTLHGTAWLGLWLTNIGERLLHRGDCDGSA